MQDIRSCTFNNSPLDRSSPFLSSSLPDLPSVYVLLSPSLQILHTLTTPPSILLPSKQLTVQQTDNRYLLGINDGHACFAIHLQLDPPVLPHNTTFAHLRTLAFTLSSEHAAIAAHARSLCEFHLRHAYCGLCGASTIPDRHGSRRRCSRNSKVKEPLDVTKSDVATCIGMWFPRLDPVAIMLIVHPNGDSVLLGRQKRFPEGMYSCLAGFMEHGEGVEDAVRREVHEESGVLVDRVRFFGSQAWPFPYSLMLGCVGLATSTDITVDENEIEHARWFGRDEIQKMVANKAGKGLFVPPKSAIAGLLCAAFANDEPITKFDSDRLGSSL